MKYTIKLFSLILLAPAVLVGTEWDVPILPLSEIHRGMRGVGKTVYYGEQIEEFGVEVIDVVENYYPKRAIILVRLSGEEAERAGVVSGMSGSPVYIDGKLIGALALRLGSFMKEPIAGITPIRDMLEVAEKESVRTLEARSRASSFEQYIQAALCGAEAGFWNELLAAPGEVQWPGSAALQTISSPLVLSGFSDRLIAELDELFSSLGFIVVSGGGAGTAIENSAPVRLELGSALSQVFITGDLSIEATGTVTAVQGDKILAFGHHIFNLGPIHMPMAEARILATLPSLMGSNKMATATRIVGTIRQDRLSGAYGDLSLKPRMIPVNLTHISPAGGERRFNFRMAEDVSLNNLLPFFLRIALIQAMTSARLSGGENATRLEGEIAFEDGRTLEMADLFSHRRILGFFAAGTDISGVGDRVAAVLGALMVNDFRSPAVESVQLKTRVLPGERIANIESVLQDAKRAEPGDTVNFQINLRTTQGRRIKKRHQYILPLNLPNTPVSVLVSSAAALTRYEVKVNPLKYNPVNFHQLLRLLEQRRRNDHLYVQVRGMDSGMMIEGEELSSLPPSILNVMDSRMESGSSIRVADRVLYESAIPMDYLISGAKRTTVFIEQAGGESRSRGNGDRLRRTIDNRRR